MHRPHSHSRYSTLTCFGLGGGSLGSFPLSGTITYFLQCVRRRFSISFSSQSFKFYTNCYNTDYVHVSVFDLLACVVTEQRGNTSGCIAAHELHWAALSCLWTFCEAATTRRWANPKVLKSSQLCHKNSQQDKKQTKNTKFIGIKKETGIFWRGKRFLQTYYMSNVYTIITGRSDKIGSIPPHDHWWGTWRCGGASRRLWLFRAGISIREIPAIEDTHTPTQQRKVQLSRSLIQEVLKSLWINSIETEVHFKFTALLFQKLGRTPSEIISILWFDYN